MPVARFSARGLLSADLLLGVFDADHRRRRVGKEADILVVEGNPLRNLDALTAVRAVIHSGVAIRNQSAS